MKEVTTLTLMTQNNMYFCAAQNPAGRAPTQEEFEHFLHARTKHSSKARAQIAIWQPHLLGDDKLIPLLWKFIKRYTFTKVNYSTLQLNPRQAWWMIIPVDHELENHPHWCNHIIPRQKMIDYMLGAPIEWGSAFQLDTLLTLNNEFGRVTTVAGQHGFSTTCSNQVVLAAKEFNLIFGKYFNHVPVIPYMMLQLWNKPSIVRSTIAGRQTTNNGAMTFYNQEAFDYHRTDNVGIANRVQQAHWMEDGEITRILTKEEYAEHFEFGEYQKMPETPNWNMDGVLWK